ncbi:hypothetical protein [Hymenobacter nivis]|uniref:Uncharacterized protein n=1 Tax=Hymenobacter nivis TaxID=1850093 RepID=A0A2Z3GSA6_9BACT|nr:hypothetical protein [Hymenobacter nivis]AWM33935.1 hypothetical protein DDQ68_14755 [Hymenobacter nivis]
MPGPWARAGRLGRWLVHPFISQEPVFYRAAAVCLLAAVLFWQMNALNKTYSTRLSCPLAWHYDTARYVSLRPLPAAVPVVVTGQGWRLLRANLGMGLHPAELYPVPRPGTRYLSASTWQHSLQRALEGLQVDEWASDTLRLTFDHYATRRLPLVLAAPDSGRAPDYTAHFEPTSLTFRGPASVVAHLPNPYPVAVPAGTGPGIARLPVWAPALVHPAAAQVRAELRPQQPSQRSSY